MTEKVKQGGMELGRGRRAPYTQVGDWVALAPISHAAARLYHLLAAHLNQARGDSLVWPSRATLAAMMGYSRANKVDPLLRELESIGAIEVERGRRHQDGSLAPNLYLVHETPPPGHSGHVSLESWYEAARQERKDSLGVGPKRGLGVGPKRGLGVGPKRGLGVGPKRGPKLEEDELDEVELDEAELPTSPTPPQTSSPSAGTAEQAGRQEKIKPNPQPQPEPGVESGDQEQAGEVIAAIRWPARARVDQSTQQRLTELATRCLAAGHSIETVRSAVAEGLPAVWGAGLLVHRLVELAATDPASALRTGVRADVPGQSGREPLPDEDELQRGWLELGV